MTDLRILIETLSDHNVDFVLIGGVALVVHGSGRTTEDLDICYDRSEANLKRLADALGGLHPTLRGAPAELPFRLDARTLRSGLNFTLSTDAGDLDLLGEVAGVGGFAELAPDAQVVELFGRPVRVAGLDDLEAAKRAAGRIKDLADLEIILAIRDRDT